MKLTPVTEKTLVICHSSPLRLLDGDSMCEDCVIVTREEYNAVLLEEHAVEIANLQDDLKEKLEP